MKYDNDVSLALVRMLDAFSNSEKQAVCEAREIISRYNKLGPNARRVLLALAERLVVGIPHGDFDKPHDWDKESSEEALDLAVYQAAKLLGLGKAEARGRDLNEVRIADGPFNGSYFCAKTGNFLCSTDGRTFDGKPWVPPVGARVQVVYQPKYGCVDSIVGRTLTVKRVKQVQKPTGALHDGIVEIEFEGFDESRDVRVVPA